MAKLCILKLAGFLVFPGGIFQARMVKEFREEPD